MDIALTGVTKRYRRGALALDGLDLTVPGGMFGLLGANGAGKTTLMRLLAGLLQPTAGTVRVGGHDLAARSGRRAVRRALGYLPQEAGVYPSVLHDHPMRNVLTNVVGARPDVDVSIGECDLADGELLLLCTDGLHNGVPDEQMAAILQAETDLQRAADTLV